MKLVLFVEGHTEKKALPGFLKRWLDPQLSRPVGIKTVRFEGWRDYYDEIGKKVHLNLSGKVGTMWLVRSVCSISTGPTSTPRP